MCSRLRPGKTARRHNSARVVLCFSMTRLGLLGFVCVGCAAAGTSVPSRAPLPAAASSVTGGGIGANIVPAEPLEVPEHVEPTSCLGAMQWNGLHCAQPATSASPQGELAAIESDIQRLLAGASMPYTGGVSDVLLSFRREKALSLTLDAKLDDFERTCASRDWVAASEVRRGMLHDALWVKLMAVRFASPSPRCWSLSPAQLTMNSRQARASNTKSPAAEPDAQQTAELAAEFFAEAELAVSRYATATALGAGARFPYAGLALERLAYLTRALGNDAMRDFVERTQVPTGPRSFTHLKYEDDMYVGANFARW
jgi:hypothetical protein